MDNLGKVYKEMGKYDEAIEQFKAKLALTPNNEQDNLTTLRNIFELYKAKKDDISAANYAEQVLEVIASYNKDDNEKVVQALNEICSFQAASAEHNDATCFETKKYLQDHESAYLSLGNCKSEDTLITSFQTLTKQWQICDLAS